MPNVGGVDYPYTPQGMAEARRAAANLGQTVPGYAVGGAAGGGGEGRGDPREGFDTTGSSVKFNPGLGWNWSTALQIANLAPHSLATSAAFSALGLMGDYGVVGGPVRPQIGGAFPGGTQDDLKAAREATKAQRAVAKALDIDATMPSTTIDAGSSTGQAVGGGGFGFGGAGSGGITGHGGRGGLGRNTPAKDGGLIEAQGGLGFRPLGYAEGDLVDEAWNDFEAVTKSDLTKVEMARYLYDNLERLKKAAADNTARTRMLDQVMRWSGFDEYRESIMPQSGEEPPLPTPLPDSTDSLFEAIAGQPGGVRPGDTGPSVGGPSVGGPYSNLPRLEGRGMAPRESPKDSAPAGARDWQGEDWMHYDRLKELYPPSEWDKKRGFGKPGDRTWSYSDFSEGIADGGYVGRRPGHYAHGGYTSRGTVAGELPRYGHMSVREEGETMGELSKRHRDQDWYRRMRGGLGSLGPRRRVA